MLYQSFSHNNINFRTPKWKLLQTIQQIFTNGQLAQQYPCSPQLTHPFMSVWIQSPSYKLDQEINSDFILNDRSNIFWHTFFKRYLVLLLLNLHIKREKQKEEKKIINLGPSLDFPDHLGQYEGHQSKEFVMCRHMKNKYFFLGNLVNRLKKYIYRQKNKMFVTHSKPMMFSS